MVIYNIFIKFLFDFNVLVFEVFVLFEKMKVMGIIFSFYIYLILIDGCCKKNRIEKVLLFFEEMDEKGFFFCFVAYCSLINSFGKVKCYDVVKELF